MKTPRTNPLWWIGALGLLTGCAGEPAKQRNQSLPSSSATNAIDSPQKTSLPSELRPANPATPEHPGVEITVALIDAAEFEAAITRHQGNVVLVDCWATWCLPCIKGFPETVALSRKYADEGLRVISLSFDDPNDEETKAKVLEFLQKHEATFENYISLVELDQGAADVFAIEGGSIPHYKLYDRNGQLLRTFSNSDPEQEFSHEMISAAVEAALK